MKIIILSLIVICSAYTLKSQDTNEWVMPYNKEKKIFLYEAVVPIPGIKKDELYKRAYYWISTYYVMGLKKIYEKDSIQGFIKLNHRFILKKMDKNQEVNDVIINYKMDLYFKDGKYRILIYKFYAGVDANAQPIERWMWTSNNQGDITKQRLTSINEEIQKTMASLKRLMQSGIPKKNTDW